MQKGLAYVGYRARESVLHTLAETDQWLQRYCEAALEAEADVAPAVEADSAAAEPATA